MEPNKHILDQFTQEHIFKLSTHSPIIRGVISLWEVKQITWEQALYLMVIELVKLNEEKNEKIIELTNSRSYVVHANITPEKAKEIMESYEGLLDTTKPIM